MYPAKFLTEQTRIYPLLRTVNLRHHRLLKVSFTCTLQCVRLVSKQRNQKGQFLPVSNGGSLTSLPLGGVLSYQDWWSLDAPVVWPGLAKGSLSLVLGENCQPRVTLGESWGIKLQAPEEESRAVMDCLSWKRMGGGVRVTAEGLRPH